MTSIETLVRNYPEKTGKEILALQEQERLQDEAEYQERHAETLAYIEDINTNGGYYMNTLLTDIEAIEAIQTDTRAGCILMLFELAKFKKRLQAKALIIDDPDFEMKRLYEWLQSENREPAQTKFTAGWTRNVAKEFEYQLKKTPSSR